ncbi:hypothetical protein WJ69_13575 [Burkholderia ubonensis]|nr:hypothetical protein WJ69_13575 [Burkholderia ubonensis]
MTNRICAGAGARHARSGARGAVVVSHAVSITTIRTWIQGEALGMCIRLPGCAACVAFDTVDHHMKRGRA